MTQPFEAIKQELEKNPYIVRFQLSRHTVEMMLGEVERLQKEVTKWKTRIVNETDDLRGVNKNLRTENAELKAHIERWAQKEEHPHHVIIGKICGQCGLSWPCPTQVAKGWKE